MTETTNSWPTEIRLNEGGRRLVIGFEDGEKFELSAEYLRISSPSAEVRGHSPGERKTVAGKSSVKVLDIVPTGNYAVRLVFDDGHETGIFTWSYLYGLGRDRERNWSVYLAELAAKGLRRDA